MTPEGATFAEYAKRGFVLTPIRPGTKRPTTEGWSASERCIRNARIAGDLQAAGLAHAYSGTCALDIDDADAARDAMRDLGIDLDEWLADPGMVRIDSGQPGHMKFLFALESPLPTRVLAYTADKRHAAQLRCATADGRTVQDVLPPSPHPDGGRYTWSGDWRHLPPLPHRLLDWWQTPEVPMATAPAAPTNCTEALGALLEGIDPDCSYTEWIRIGMAIHHETEGSEEGLRAWDGWSSGGDKYRGLKDLQAHWRSFGKSASPVTLAELHQQRVAVPEEFPIVEDAPDDRPKPFTPVHVSDWAKRPAPAWLVAQILPERALAMLYGPPKSGKSFLALDIAMAVARGVPWRDYRVVQGPVAWIAAEAAGSMRNRVRAYASASEVDLDGVPFWIIGDTPRLSEKRHLGALASAAMGVGAKLIVVDTLAAASGGVNENSPEMNAVLSGCHALHNATGALVLLVHHAGKDAGRGARGWSGIGAAMDTLIEVSRPSEGSVRVATLAEQRDGEDGIAMPFILQVAAADLENTSCVVEHVSQAVVEQRAPQSPPFEQSPLGPHVQAAIITSSAGDTDIADFEDLL